MDRFIRGLAIVLLICAVVYGATAVARRRKNAPPGLLPQDGRGTFTQQIDPNKPLPLQSVEMPQSPEIKEAPRVATSLPPLKLLREKRPAGQRTPVPPPQSSTEK